MRLPRSPLAATTTALLCVGALSACTMGHDASGSPSGSTPPGSASAPQASPQTPSPTSTEPSAKDVWAHTQARVGQYTALKVAGTDTANGTGPSITFSGDLDGEPSEAIFKSTTIGNFTMRRIDKMIYLKGDKAYWESVQKQAPNKKGATSAANRWLKVPAAAMPKKDLADVSAKTYIDAIADTSDPKWGSIADAGASLTHESIAGKDAYKIVSDDGDTTVWVSTDGTYNLMKIVDQQAGANDLGNATFSQWNEKFSITAPSDAVAGGSGTTGTTTT